MKERRTGRDRRVRDTTDKIDISALQEARQTQEYRAVNAQPTHVSVQLTDDTFAFLQSEAEREGLSLELTASLLFTRGINMIKQVRRFREKAPLLVAKEKDSYYRNASPSDYRRDI